MRTIIFEIHGFLNLSNHENDLIPKLAEARKKIESRLNDFLQAETEKEPQQAEVGFIASGYANNNIRVKVFPEAGALLIDHMKNDAFKNVIVDELQSLTSGKVRIILHNSPWMDKTPKREKEEKHGD